MSDTNLYYELLHAYDLLLQRIDQVQQEHAACPGCDLCIEAAGQLHTLRMYQGTLNCDAPADSFKRLLRDDEELSAEIRADKLAAEPEPAELPPASSRPYWLP